MAAMVARHCGHQVARFPGRSPYLAMLEDKPTVGSGGADSIWPLLRGRGEEPTEPGDGRGVRSRLLHRQAAGEGSTALPHRNRLLVQLDPLGRVDCCMWRIAIIGQIAGPGK